MILRRDRVITHQTERRRGREERARGCARARASEREKVHSGQASRKSLSRTTPGGNVTASLRGWGTVDEEPFRFSFRSSTVVDLMWSAQYRMCIGCQVWGSEFLVSCSLPNKSVGLRF